MPSAPLYRRGEVVYLASSAGIGKLEAYKVSSIKQIQDGRWVYGIDIGKKPPSPGLVGDSFDMRIAELTLHYTEIELVTVCEALDIICTKFALQINALELQKTARCAESDAPIVNLDEPRWGIGDPVYFSASARIGFMHQDFIKSIHEIGIQPGSRRTRFTYQVTNVPNPSLYFRQDELITYCEAATLALAANKRDLTAAEAKRTSLCPPSI